MIFKLSPMRQKSKIFDQSYIFYRNDPYVGCEKIDEEYCICFIPNVQEAEVKILQQAIEIYRKGPNCQDIPINRLSVFRPRDFFILSEFFTRYGSIIRKNE
jgi:hypothetical protein